MRMAFPLGIGFNALINGNAAVMYKTPPGSMCTTQADA